MNIEIFHSKSMAEPELETRSFDAKPRALVGHRVAEVTIRGWKLIYGAGVQDGSLVTRQEDASCQERKVLWLKLR